MAVNPKPSICPIEPTFEPTLASPWLTVREAASRAKCGTRSIYNATRRGKLRAARLGGRRELRFLSEWVDAWLIEASRPIMVNEQPPARGLNDR